mgnify:CR=1 FL=1
MNEPSEPLGLTVHSLPTPVDAMTRQRASGRFKMLLIMAACAAPMIASYTLYYAMRPTGGATAYSDLIQPTVPMPAVPAQPLDGGAPQVRAAQDALMAVGMSDLPVVGLAKRLEEVWLPDEADPIILPRTSEALYLLQRVRDEAHRTAIALHRKRRGKRATVSALDDIPGLGPTKAKSLLRHFGSVKRVRAATVPELCEAPGIGPVVAEAIHAALHDDEAGSPDPGQG